MLTPKTKERRRRRFKTYDFEWYPETLELRCLGVFDGDAYSWHRTPEAFLLAELTPENSGCWYYAHAGGSHDLMFLLEAFADNEEGWRVDGAFAGSSVVIARVTNGKHKWVFLDSFWLIRQGLRQIGDWLGYPKGDCAFDAPLPELLEYNELDCRVLFRAIETMEDIIWDLGGELQVTIASSALDLFRRKYLSEDIRPLPEINAIARRAYVGSRVEVFRKQVKRADYYDINSSFPFSMLQPAPGKLLAHRRTLRDSDDLFLALVCVDVQTPIPCLPWRDTGGRVFFPNGPRWQWLMHHDVRLAESEGALREVSEVYTFAPNTDLAAYVTALYDLRKKARSEGHEALSQALKIFLNSLYGKFGESSEKEGLLINPKRWQLKDKAWEMVTPGVYLVRHEQPAPHEHVPFAAAITAHARANLYHHLVKRPAYYCDTDGFACKAGSRLPCGPELGELKLEHRIRDAHFEAPKLYTYVDAETDERTIKAKGFSKIAGKGKLTYDDFAHLLEHKEVTLEQFARAKGILRGDLKPRTGTIQKTYRGTVRPKRKFLKNGGSRPWQIKELE